MGRIQCQYPLYIARRSILAEKIVREAHKRTIHGGVIPTMNVNAEEFWPRQNASEIARIRITDLANDGMEEPLNK